KVAHAGEANSSIFGVLSGDSTVLTMDEDSHLRRRRLLLPSFHGERMQVYFDEMREVTMRAVNSWAIGQRFPMQRETQRIPLQVKDEDGQPLTDRAVRDEVVTMLMAGHETTGTALAWAFERILSLPEVQAKIEAELESVSGGGPLLTEHMAKLEYLQAVIDETH